MSLYQEMANKVISTAHKYIGQKEIPDNKGFYDKYFDTKMDNVGFKKPLPWCAYFVKMVFKDALESSYSKHYKKIKRKLTPGALNTMSLLIGMGYKLKKNPKPGDIVVWQSGTSTKGHIGIVVGIKGSKIVTIEGNTNAAGSREGGMVAKKTRVNRIKKKKKGLHIRGYISPYPDYKESEEIGVAKPPYKSSYFTETPTNSKGSSDSESSYYTKGSSDSESSKSDTSSLLGDFSSNDDTQNSDDETNIREVFSELNDFLLTGKDMANSIPDKKDGEFTETKEAEVPIITIINPEHPVDEIVLNAEEK